MYIIYIMYVPTAMKKNWEKIYSHNLKYGYYVIYSHAIINNCEHAIFVVVDNSNGR